MTLIWWIFTFRKVNKLIEFTKISNLYSYSDTGSTFKEPLQLNKSVSVHHNETNLIQTNIQTLIRAVHKIVNNIYPPIMKIFFSWRGKQMQPWKFQRKKAAKNKNYLSSHETTFYHASQLIFLEYIRSFPKVNLFKSKIKYWKWAECPCKLCKNYLKNIGYLSSKWDEVMG